MSAYRGQTVRDKKGKNIGIRHVLYCAETRMYVNHTGTGQTADRFWAWTGTREQAMNCARLFDVPSSFRAIRDGDERETV